MSGAIHPTVKAWILADPRNEHVVLRLIQALEHVDRFGRVEIKVDQGRVADIKAISELKT